MAFLNFRKKVWHNPEYKKQCKQLDIYFMVSAACLGLSFWLLPYLTDKYIYITELFVLITIGIGIRSWLIERKDNKYVPPMKEEDINTLK